MPEIKLNITKKKFSGTFRKIHGIDARFRVILGGANAGKSFAVAQDEILYSLKHKGTKTLVIRKVASTVKDSIFESFKNRLKEFGLLGRYQERLSPFDIILPNGSMFLFRGLDDPEKMKSIEGITRIVVEEATELSIDDFKELNRRMRGGRNPQMSLLFNPIDENHWIKKHFFTEDKPIVNAACILVTYQDNEFATDDDIAELESLKEYDENQYNIYVLAKWGKLKTGSEFYPHFSKIKHLGVVPYIKGEPVHLTWDFNTVPYMTCLALQIEFVKKYINAQGIKSIVPVFGYSAIDVLTLRVYREYCFVSPRNSVESICDQFSTEHDPAYTEVFYYGDGMGLNRIEGLGAKTRFSYVVEGLSAYLTNASKRVKQPNVGTGKRRDLLDEILFGKHPEVEIIIDEDSCPRLIEDFENVKQGVKGKAKDRYKDPVTKETYERWGHCFIGSTMVETEKGAVRIDNIQVGDLVLTRKGFKKVKKVFDNGIQDVNQYNLSGFKITCTPDHKVWTKEDGFKKVSSLTHSNTLCVLDENNSLCYQHLEDVHSQREPNLGKPEKRQRVYDIMVEDEHEYFANGILAHNCLDALEYLVSELCKQFID